jgi:carbon-monoxide dehydrogenase medium subunit
MKPLPPFRAHRPRTLEEALRLLKEMEDARPIAGGTDIIPAMREGALRAKNLIDLTLIEELRGIWERGNEILIGATTTLSQLEESKTIAERAPALRAAASSIGSVQIRKLGTIGGNLCNASPAADTAPPLLALNAAVEIASEDGTRTMPLSGLFAGPKMNTLKPHELLTSVRFRIPPDGAGMSFQKLGRRRGHTISLVNASAYLELEGGTCLEARLALGSVAPTPIRVRGAEELMRGRRVTEELIEEAASTCYELVSPIDDLRASADYRREMARVLARRALREAWEKAGR